MNEADVEDLYAHIVKGIPVDILYERVVVQREADHTVVYYIYPDGYGKEPLDVSKVKAKLAPFGVASCVSDDDIKQAIEAPMEIPDTWRRFTTSTWTAGNWTPEPSAKTAISTSLSCPWPGPPASKPTGPPTGTRSAPPMAAQGSSEKPLPLNRRRRRPCPPPPRRKPG